jgi:hypothetical protein
MFIIGQIIWPLKEGANQICPSADGTTGTGRKPSRTLTSWLMSVTKVKEMRVSGARKNKKRKMGKRNLTSPTTLLPKLRDKKLCSLMSPNRPMA